MSDILLLICIKKKSQILFLIEFFDFPASFIPARHSLAAFALLPEYQLLLHEKNVLIIVIILAVCTHVSVGPKRPSTGPSPDRIWCSYTTRCRGREICEGLYSASISYAPFHRSRRPNSVCRKWRTYSTIPMNRVFGIRLLCYALYCKNWVSKLYSFQRKGVKWMERVYFVLENQQNRDEAMYFI